jgi:pyruvate/2-oxoglutarate dehydrogenase complex dihydrolipoamide dehydrogenase (E3) component
VSHFDLAVIGAGSGGLSVAAAAAQFGRKVVLFEKHRMGGDCLNTGCVPSKALLAAAEAAERVREASRFGIATQEPRVDFAAVMAHVRSSIAALAPHDSRDRFEALGVTVVAAAARFVAARKLEAGGQRYSARHMVIATGARPAVPDIPGLAEVPFLTTDTLFGLAAQPRHLVVIGGGPIGLEMAQAFRRLGSAVTVIEQAVLLSREDPEAAAVVRQQLAAEGVTLMTRTPVLRVRTDAAGLAVETAHGTVTGSHLLVAVGRRPNVEDLDLAAAGIAFTPKGIAVDRFLRTSARGVFAIGDVAGGGQFTHVAGYQAGRVIRQALFALPAGLPSWPLPRVTFTDPELAQAGLTEAEARAAHGTAVQVWRAPFAGNDRAVTEAATEGFVKVMAGRSGRILGCTIAGRQAGELIAPWQLAIEQGLKLSAMAQSVVPYPTRAGAGPRAAMAGFSGLAANPWLRRLIGVLSGLR